MVLKVFSFGGGVQSSFLEEDAQLCESGYCFV